MYARAMHGITTLEELMRWIADMARSDTGFVSSFEAGLSAMRVRLK